MKNNDIDKFFRDAFEKAEETPNSTIWSKIEMQLDTDKKIIPFVKRNNWVKYAIAACMILICGIVFKQFKNNEQILNIPNEPKIAQVEPKEDDKSNYNVKLEEYSTTENTPQSIKAESVSISQTNETDATVSTAALQLTSTEESSTKNIDLVTIESSSITPVQVTEIEPVKPLIENAEEIPESMYATLPSNDQKHSNIVTNVLNKITENIELSDSKNIRFSADEEGSIRIDIINSLVKNRFKKRK